MHGVLDIGHAPHRVALGIDIRERGFLQGFSRFLKLFKKERIPYRILFLDASDYALLQRFSETRHRHPLGFRLSRAIHEERKKLREIKALADKVIDTSGMALGELKEVLSGALELRKAREMSLAVLSFGYKYGIPLDADLVMDVRFLPNPNYQKSLRHRTGLHAPVRRFVLKHPWAKTFLNSFLKLLRSTLPWYIREGKSYLTLAVGCTGGRHRSVSIARAIAQALRQDGYAAREFHRDIDRV